MFVVCPPAVINDIPQNTQSFFEMYPSIQEASQCISNQTRAAIYSGVWKDHRWERLSELERVRLCRTCIRLQREEALCVKLYGSVRQFQRLGCSNPSSLDSLPLCCIVILASLPLRINSILSVPRHPWCELRPFSVCSYSSYHLNPLKMSGIDVFREAFINTSHWNYFSDCTPALIFYK